MGIWECRYYRVLNAVTRVLLRSPAHRLRSRRILLLEFRGRQSGRRYQVPVSYWEPETTTVVCLTSATWSRWWRNLDGALVVLWLRGRRRNGRADLVTDQQLRRDLVYGFLRHNVHDAHHYGVALDDTGSPAEAAVTNLAESPATKVITVSLEAVSQVP